MKLLLFFMLASRRGTISYVPGDTGVADTIEVCLKDASDNYSYQAK